MLLDRLYPLGDKLLALLIFPNRQQLDGCYLQNVESLFHLLPLKLSVGKQFHLLPVLVVLLFLE